MGKNSDPWAKRETGELPAHLSDKELEAAGLRMMESSFHRNPCDVIFQNPKTGAKVYCGGWSASQDIRVLNECGITHIVNCQDPESPNTFEGAEEITVHEIEEGSFMPTTAQRPQKHTKWVIEKKNSVGANQERFPIAVGDNPTGGSKRYQARMKHESISNIKASMKSESIKESISQSMNSIKTSASASQSSANEPSSSSSSTSPAQEAQWQSLSESIVENPGMPGGKVPGTCTGKFKLQYYRINGIDAHARTTHRAMSSLTTEIIDPARCLQRPTAMDKHLLENRKPGPHMGTKPDSIDVVFDEFTQMFTFVDTALAKGQNVLIHCAAGMHRAGGTSVAYLMHRLRLNYKDALKIAKEKRSVIAPYHKELLDHLDQYWKTYGHCEEYVGE